MSIVNTVLELLKIDVSELIMADIMTATNSPLKAKNIYQRLVSIFKYGEE